MFVERTGKSLFRNWTSFFLYVLKELNKRELGVLLLMTFCILNFLRFLEVFFRGRLGERTICMLTIWDNFGMQLFCV